MTQDILNFEKVIFVVENNYEHQSDTCETILHGLIAHQYLEKTQHLQV